ncbi:nuclear pore glycoprotein p62-like [Adelges cooleyi]|uniref:nuclear pore glycoprotein p62-like n=1 Tax=Adelges cooleyi TaxID=133065 RepID=UPI00217FDBA2|nr:nuclear pore glycoprotein p62-like [Adelges cooleyi]XP_050429507.1 nuclear pore glycoprotein p62-like [Adelges cooleyi]
MNFNFGTPKTTGPPPMFSMSSPATAPSGQTQMGIFGAATTTTQPSAPVFSLPSSMPAFGASSSLSTSTPVAPATSKSAFNLGAMNKPAFSLGPTSSFGLSTSTTSASIQFPSSSTVPAKTSVTTGFTLSTLSAPQTSTTSATPSFSIGGTTQASTGFSLGNTITKNVSTGFSFGATTQASIGTTLASTSFSLGSSNTTQPSTSFSLGGTSQPSTGFSLGSSSQPSTGFSLGGTSQPSTGSSLGGISQPSTGFSLGNTTSATGFSLGASNISTSQTSTVPATSGITTQAVVSTQSTSQSSAAQPANFQQLVDLINNWTVSLENQEKQFLNQANEITVWDNMLTNQSAKLVKLYDILERKEKEQVDIENELDFLLSQQKELEDCLVPLEQEIQSAEVLSSMNNEREPIYKAAQEIDNQVKQMSGDIKEIVNNLNKANSKKDSDDDLDTICRILNCHMTALQYIEHNAENLSTMVSEVNEEHSRFLTAANDHSFMSSFRK